MRETKVSPHAPSFYRDAGCVTMYQTLWKTNYVDDIDYTENILYKKNNIFMTLREQRSVI
jgi:hypothetical protein